MLAQRTLKMPSETDKIYLHKLRNPFTSQCRKTVRHTLKILQHLLQDFKAGPTIPQHCQENG